MTPLLAALVLRDRACLVVGGDAEAADKAAKLVAADARVTVIAPVVDPRIATMHATGLLRWEARDFAFDADLAAPPFVVVSTPRDEAFSAALHARARAVGALVCCVDQPAHCDFFHVAQGPLGGLTLGLASDGRAPMLAKRVRDDLVAGLDLPLRGLFEALSSLRSRTPPAMRRARLREALEGFAIEVRVSLPAWLRRDPEG